LTAPKYPRPQILLVDIARETQQVLEAEGYNVFSGSFGTPYKVLMGDTTVPVIPNGRLTNFAEQEIVIVDLVPTRVLDGPLGEKAVSDGTIDVWARCSLGLIDPRPRLMSSIRTKADRILASGGLFVVFADARHSQEHFLGRTRAYSWAEKEGEFPVDDWSFLSILDYLRVRNDEGREISVVANAKNSLGQLLVKHANDAAFACTLDPEASIEKAWITLAKSKYEEPVAGIIASPELRGSILILPQIEDKPQFLASLLKNVMPELMPHLFPHAEGARWVKRPEYEMPDVQVLKDEARKIEEEARKKVAELEEAIEAERAKTSYIHDLIGGNDRPLVLAVKRVLEVMGFESVIDVDEAMEAAGDTGPRREDLQIQDKSPTLLIEVKGMAGMPSDEDAMAVSKYLVPRMKEWGRTDVKGLSIMNHQRHIPALDRENEKAFREDVVINAEEQDIGLLSAWDLHKLLRSYLKNDWSPEYVKPLLYKSGRISPVPNHYELVGTIEGFIPKLGVVGIRITGEKLHRGDHIAFELPVEFQEQEAKSLEVDNQQVDEAVSGSIVGILTGLTKDKAKQGTRVFRLI